MYCFSNIRPRDYVVVETQPALYTSLYDYDYSTGAFDLDGVDSTGGPDNNIPVTLLPAEADEDNDFVELAAKGLISGYVRNDIDGPLSGVTIRLYADADTNGVKEGAVITTATTNASGYYEFTDVLHGSYIVE
jgi:hypothetical protein